MSTQDQDIEDYHSLILNRTPFIDVRAPIEYLSGAMPTATNLSLMSDDEREAVGICYKHKGRQAAIQLGHSLVTGDDRANRVQSWIHEYTEYPQSVIYCARGGLRSKIAQQWLKDLGYEVPRVHLGYKGLRNYLLSVLNQVSEHPMLIVSGDTGTGKTELLNTFQSTIDLEGLANHHGSAFGKTLTPQPSQATFENTLATECVLKAKEKTWLVEDESRNIGRVHLPEIWYQTMKSAPLVVIDEPLNNRLARIGHLYFRDMAEQYRQTYGLTLGWQNYTHYLEMGLASLQKRLGLERYRIMTQQLNEALSYQQQTDEIEGHNTWLSALLLDYYDPMYHYQLDQKKDRVLFRGSYEEVQHFIQHFTE